MYLQRRNESLCATVDQLNRRVVDLANDVEQHEETLRHLLEAASSTARVQWVRPSPRVLRRAHRAPEGSARRPRGVTGTAAKTSCLLGGGSPLLTQMTDRRSKTTQHGCIDAVLHKWKVQGRKDIEGRLCEGCARR